MASCETLGSKTDPYGLLATDICKCLMNVDSLVLSLLLVSIFVIVQSPIDRDIGEGHLASPKRQVARKKLNLRTPWLQPWEYVRFKMLKGGYPTENMIIKELKSLFCRLPLCGLFKPLSFKM